MQYLVSIFLFIILSFNLSLSKDGNPVITYSFDDATKLTIAGTSNVNSFDCKCNDKFPKSSIRINFDSPNKIRFSNGKLLLKSSKLDCNNSRMNKDLCDALKADQYPNIIIDLLDAKVDAGLLEKLDNWVDIKVTVALTITNISKLHTMAVKVIRVAPNKLRFTCSHEILLTDFGIEPPTALLGFIKVNNKIKINFDIQAFIEN